LRIIGPKEIGDSSEQQLNVSLSNLLGEDIPIAHPFMNLVPMFLANSLLLSFTEDAEVSSRGRLVLLLEVQTSQFDLTVEVFCTVIDEHSIRI
jgi:hypothetical protein